MSQKATRKSQTATAVSEEKEKDDTPVKEMKKKIAANAEKDKQTAEKVDKPTDKSGKSEPADKNKPTDKPDKNGEKSDKNEKHDKDKPTEKKTDKTEKAAEKKLDKSAEKKTDKPVEKKTETQIEKDESKGDKAKEKPIKPMNGTHNGAANGDDANGTVSDDSDVELVIEEDELFPELTYDDSDSGAEEAPSRSLTRRSQVKATKTPETPAPRPASEKESDDSKESKVLKLKDDSVTSDRKLRSADSPKPESKKKHDSPKKHDSGQEEDKKSTKKDLEGSKKDVESAADKKEPKDGKGEENTGKMEVDVVIEVDTTEGVATRTRARVSPYSRSRLDRTATSVMADYTGNNSTMEMDITESSIAEEASLNDSAYLRGLRGIRGRSSYKQLKELKLTNPNANRPRPPPTAATVRPTGAVVGRKRKPSSDAPPSPPERVESGEEASEDLFVSHGKRMKLFDRISMPFRRSITRRSADIVGINTDLPLTAPVASTSFASFDPESMKPPPAHPAPGEPLATPLPPPLAASLHDRDGKRCVIM